VLRVAWTLADLAGVDQPGHDQIRLAVDLRAGRSFTIPVAAPSRTALRAVVS
jgi:hypothetical protein